MGKRSTKIIPFLAGVKENYILQFTSGEFTEVNFSGCCSYTPPSLFKEIQNFNFFDEADKTIVYQWFILKNDWRFENYTRYMLVPNRLENISHVSIVDLLNFVSPHNIFNLKG